MRGHRHSQEVALCGALLGVLGGSISKMLRLPAMRAVAMNRQRTLTVQEALLASTNRTASQFECHTHGMYCSLTSDQRTVGVCWQCPGYLHS